MPPALIPARMVANSRSVQRAISGYPSSSTRTNQKTSFLGIHKEGNIQVCAALNGIVKIIKAQSFCVFFVKEVIVVKLHDIAGKFASFEGQVFVYGV
ncbi:hypothetical protein H5U53_24255 [Escherichia coli]|nr:hypothetical protein [Escherichia coli]EFC5910414.1 hypothetical protein [Escherichia coli]EFC5924785.1 hypothetical protein [Escherichia coli]EFC5929501.1 hypothetical protein [Escherichia coli]EFC5934144.1 hypothetical protein [Escherichia coli]